ncbi:MAG: hypothetical protein U0703_18425 [Anaerolineae bacterium]
MPVKDDTPAGQVIQPLMQLISVVFLITFVIFIIGGVLVSLSAIRSLRSKSYLVPKYKPTYEDFM